MATERSGGCGESRLQRKELASSSGITRPGEAAAGSRPSAAPDPDVAARWNFLAHLGHGLRPRSEIE